jgi:hypothetical protein
MAMINCPVCGHAMSTTAAACPNCGHVMKATTTAPAAAAPVHRKKRVGPGRWLAGLFFLILLLLIALWYFDVVNFT